MSTWKRQLIFDKKTAFRFLFFGFWVIYFIFFWSRALQLDEDGNLLVFHIGMWGDWSSHLTMGSAMAFRKLFLQTNPFLITAPFNYPFVSNLLSALLIRIGVPFFKSFLIPSFFLSLLVIFVVYFFYATIFKSEKVAWVSSILFLLNGGFGFKYYFSDIADASPSEIWNSIFLPLHRYTDWRDKNLFCSNVIDTMVIPQRSFALGFPLAILVLILFLRPAVRAQAKFIILAGIIIGLMPIIHPHSFMCVSIILFFWALLELINNRKDFLNTTMKSWGLFWGITILLGIFFIINSLSPKKLSHNFLSWLPGWYAKENEINWFKFWFMNWTVMPLAALAAWWHLRAAEKRKKIIPSTSNLFIPFFLLFALMNLFLFQPWIWDNTKILVWASLGFSGLVGWLIVDLWKEDEIRTFFSAAARKFLLVRRTVCMALFFLLIFSGLLDVIRLQIHSRNKEIWYTEEDLRLSRWAKENTSINSIWLTSDKHNHWLSNLTGRQNLMGYEGWVWTYGLDSSAVQADVIDMYHNPSRSDLFAKYKINYAVIGTSEKRGLSAKVAEFDRLFKKIYETETTTIYQVS